MVGADKVKMQIIENADKIANVVKQGKDVEIRRDNSGIKILEVKKNILK